MPPIRLGFLGELLRLVQLLQVLGLKDPALCRQQGGVTDFSGWEAVRFLKVDLGAAARAVCAFAHVGLPESHDRHRAGVVEGSGPDGAGTKAYPLPRKLAIWSWWPEGRKIREGENG